MDDFGNILYILAMLGALIYSAVRKSKQAKNQGQEVEDTTGRTSYDPMEEEDVLNDLRELFKPQQPKVEPKPAPQEGKPEPLFMKSKPETITRRVKTVKREEPEVHPVVDDIYGGDFDARKAVIYSEILNRPYV